MPLSRFTLLYLAIATSATPLFSAETDPVQIRTGFGNLMYRCAVEKKARIAFLGGSITQNGKGHVAMLTEWLRAKYPEAEIEALNAGLSSTCSVTGAFRVGDEVLSKGPLDLLVVEFAVNDDQDAAHTRENAIRGMEGVIRQTREQHPAADILMVHYVNPEMLALAEKGETAISIGAHEAVAAHWGITSVNVTTALAASTKAGGMNWQAYGGVHPKAEGYRFATDLMIRAMEGSQPADKVAHHPVPGKPLDPGSFAKVKIIDLQQASWLGGWQYGTVGKALLPAGSIRGDYEGRPLLRADDPGSTLYVDFTGSSLTAFVLAGPDSGSLEVSVDGGDWTPVTLFHRHSKGLNYPRSVILMPPGPPGFHQVAIRTAEAKPEGSTGTSASILKLSVAE